MKMAFPLLVEKVLCSTIWGPQHTNIYQLYLKMCKVFEWYLNVFFGRFLNVKQMRAATWDLTFCLAFMYYGGEKTDFLANHQNKQTFWPHDQLKNCFRGKEQEDVFLLAYLSHFFWFLIFGQASSNRFRVLYHRPRCLRIFGLWSGPAGEDRSMLAEICHYHPYLAWMNINCCTWLLDYGWDNGSFQLFCDCLQWCDFLIWIDLLIWIDQTLLFRFFLRQASVTQNVELLPQVIDCCFGQLFWHG